MVASLLFEGELLRGDAVEETARSDVTGLERLGCSEGDVVAIMLRNEPAYLVSALMCRLGGFYACPINWHFKADEAGYILRDSGARVLVIHADLLGQVASAIPPDVAVVVVEPPPTLIAAFSLDADACRSPSGSVEWRKWLADSQPYSGPDRQPRGSLPYSSGTTGRPKGIKRQPLDPSRVRQMAEVCRITLGTEPGMRTAAVTPFYHSAPALYYIQALLAGELISIHPRFDAERLLAEIEQLRLTRLYLVPTLYVRLLRLSDEVKRRYDLSSLKFVASTGAPCPPEIKRAMIEWWGPVITETYASSEAGLITFCSAQDAMARPGTAGRVLPSCSLKILDEQGRPVSPGEIGSIYTRHEAYPDFTYLNNEPARRAMEVDGYITVGDLGYLDDDGYLFVRDRKADMVISGGVNIYPVEIEATLIQMPEVIDCAVFGIPDSEYGEALAAHVQTRPGATITPDAVRAFLRTRIADYKVPKVIELADELPREETGKVFKRKLREPYWQGAGRTI